MKSPLKLQSKLRSILSGRSDIHLWIPLLPWTEKEMVEAAWVVEAFLHRQNNVVDCDPLEEWLEEYLFYIADSNK